MQRLIAGAAATAILLCGHVAHADTITNIDLSSLYNGDWSGEINGPAIQAGAESVTGNTGSGLSFQDSTGSYVEMFWNGSGNSPNSITIGSLAISLTSSSSVNGLFNNFFGSTNTEATVTMTNSLSQTAQYSLIGGQTIRDYNNDGFVNTLSGSNSDPATDGDVTAQAWWTADSGGTNPSSPGSPSSRLDAQSFSLPSSWDGTSLTSIEIVDSDVINADLILSALQVDAGTPATAVPEPASLALFASALIGFGAIRRRRKA